MNFKREKKTNKTSKNPGEKKKNQEEKKKLSFSFFMELFEEKKNLD